MFGVGDSYAWGFYAKYEAVDMLLQVHRFDAAAAAYTAAAALIGNTPRITLGLARVAVQMKQTEPACRAYRSFVAGGTGSASSTESAEARAFVDAQCATARANK
jgi:hypothetical protein